MVDVLGDLAQHFDEVQLSPQDWPVYVFGIMASDAARAHWPNFPDAALAENGRMGHGCGLNSKAASVRGLGEAIEIASCCAWGDETLISASASELGTNAWPVECVTGFSAAQQRDRAQWNQRFCGLDWIPQLSLPDQTVEWIAAQCLTGDGQILIPADAVVIGRHTRNDPMACADADTSGCAAGQDWESACLAAIYELIERDATGRWWYGQRPRQTIRSDVVPLGETVAHALALRARVLWLIDITTDLNVPVVAAIATDISGQRITAGYAARSSIPCAATAALRELMLVELRLVPHPLIAGVAADLKTWFSEAQFSGLPPFHDNATCSSQSLSSDIDDDLTACIAQLKRSGCRVATIDFSRPEFGVAVCRAISPDLCHWKPRFARARLLAPDNRDLDYEATKTRSRNTVLMRL